MAWQREQGYSRYTLSTETNLVPNGMATVGMAVALPNNPNGIATVGISIELEVAMIGHFGLYMKAPFKCALEVVSALICAIMSTYTKPAYDRVKGCIFGCALGDTLGLPAEGNIKSILEERFPNGISLPHLTGVRGWNANSFSDDTEQTVLMMRALSTARDDAAGVACHFARGLKKWYAEGFSELGETFGMGCGGTTWRVLKRDEFESDPFGAAASIVGPRAGNGALMRTAPCAFTGDPAGWARHLCATTHADPMAEATCVAQCLLIRDLCETPLGSLSSEVLRRAIGPATAVLAAPLRSEFMEIISRPTLDALELDSRDARSYTLKSFACSIWAFRRLYNATTKKEAMDEALFRTIITSIVMKAGDADTNAAIAGAVVGSHLGYNNLPADWIASLPNREWLEREIDTWYATL